MLAELIRIEAVPVFTALAAALASFGCVIGDRRPARRPITGRSACACGRQLHARDMVPVLSWLASRGRARCCGARIPRRYVIIETLSAALGLGVGLIVDSSAERSGPVVALLYGLLLLGAIFLGVVRAAWQHDPARRPLA